MTTPDISTFPCAAKNKLLARTSRLLTGTLLISAALLKSHHLLTTPLAENGILTNRWFWTVTVEFELILGVLLLARGAPMRTWIAAVAAFTAFVAFTAYQSWAGESSCGCFGRIQVDPRVTLILDIGVLLLLVIGGPDKRAPSEHRASSLQLVIAVSTATIGVSLAAAVLYTQGQSRSNDDQMISSGSLVVLEPDRWIGKSLPLITHIDMGWRFKTGKWLVIIYDHTCSHCIAAMPAYRQTAERLKQNGSAIQMALIELPPYDRNRRFTNPLYSEGKLSESREWFAQTPVELLLNDGIVEQSHDKGEGLKWFSPG